MASLARTMAEKYMAPQKTTMARKEYSRPTPPVCIGRGQDAGPDGTNDFAR